MIRVLFFVMLMLQSAVYAGKSISIPEEFRITNRWYFFTSDFDVQSKEGYKMGYIHRKFFSHIFRYDFYDAEGDLLATAKMQYYTWGAIFTVTDAQNNLLGYVEERVVNHFEFFDIINAEGETQVVAALNFWRTRYTLTDPVTEAPMVELTKPFWAKLFNRITNTWTIRLMAPETFYSKNIDPRLFIITMAFQSDRDRWRSELLNKKARPILDDEVADKHSRSLVSHKISESDFAAVDAITEELLCNADPLPENITEAERTRLALELIAQLLEGDRLTATQKRALRLLIQDRDVSDRGLPN